MYKFFNIGVSRIFLITGRFKFEGIIVVAEIFSSGAELRPIEPTRVSWDDREICARWGRKNKGEGAKNLIISYICLLAPHESFFHQG